MFESSFMLEDAKIQITPCSRFPSMLWVKGVKTIDEIDYLKSSRSIEHSFPEF